MVKPKIPTELAPDLLDRLRERFGGFLLTRDWDLNIDQLEPDLARMGMLPNAHTTNGPTGIVNGGVLATLADMACALALCSRFDGEMPFATSDLHIRYLEPAQGPIAIEATVVRASLRSAILECRILCQLRVVALCTAHFTIQQRIKEKP